MHELSSAMYAAQDGQVIHSAFPVKVYHLIDGLWIESGDLHRLLKERESAKKGFSDDELYSE